MAASKNVSSCVIFFAFLSLCLSADRRHRAAQATRSRPPAGMFFFIGPQTGRRPSRKRRPVRASEIDAVALVDVGERIVDRLSAHVVASRDPIETVNDTWRHRDNDDIARLSVKWEAI